MKKSTAAIFVFLGILVFSAVVCLQYPCFESSYQEAVDFSESLDKFLEGFGFLAPLALVIVLALQVILAPLPGQIFGLASGYIYGPWIGTLISMVGLTIGSFVAFYLGRKFGRPLVERFVNKKTVKKFDYLVNRRGEITIFLIFLLPVFPDDAICFIAGLTKIPIPTLVILAVLGRLPGFITLNFVGSGVAYQNLDMAIVLFTVLMVVSGIIYIYNENIEEKLSKLVYK